MWFLTKTKGRLLTNYYFEEKIGFNLNDNMQIKYLK